MMKTTQHTFLTDNPFRLCAIGSAAEVSELRRKAAGIAQAAKVGLPPDVGLASLFGSEEVEHCPNFVRTLANDTKRLTQHRILWPLTYHHPDEPTGTLSDIDRLLTPDLETTGYATQIRFVSAWCRFLDLPSAEALRAALGHFTVLYDDTDCDSLFLQILERDQEPDPGSILYAAQDELIEHLLTTACQAASRRWHQKEVAEAMALFAVVRDSGFDADVIAKSLRGVSPLGDREQARIEKLRNNYPGWAEERANTDFTVAAPLRALAEALSGHVPAAALWAEEAERFAACVGFSMRDYAIEAVNENNDWATSYAVLKQILAEPTAIPCHDKVLEDLEALYKIMLRTAVQVVDERDDFTEARRILTLLLSDPHAASWHLQARKELAMVQVFEEQTTVFTGIRSVEHPPRLQTICGIGTKLYGHAPFPGKQGWYFATVYFCVFFIPLFAIARFHVSNAPGGGWHFHEQVPLTKGNKLHSFVSAGVILLSLLMTSVIGLSDTSGEAPPPVTSNSVVAAQPEPEPLQLGGKVEAVLREGADGVFRLDYSRAERRLRLREEGDALFLQVKAASAVIKKEAGQIDAFSSTLDRARAEIKQQRETLNSYDGAAVDAFNTRVRRLRREAADFKERIRAHNERVRKNNAKVQRLREIDRALKEMEN